MHPHRPSSTRSSSWPNGGLTGGYLGAHLQPRLPETRLRPLLGLLATTVAHFWPDFRSWLKDLKDSRDQDRITYPREFLAWEAIMGFLRLASGEISLLGLSVPEALKRSLVAYVPQAEEVEWT